MRFIGATVSGHFKKRIGIEQFRFAIEVKNGVIKHFIRASVFYLAVKCCDVAAADFNDDYYFQHIYYILQIVDRYLGCHTFIPVS